jgi:hypothetical protein
MILSTEFWIVGPHWVTHGVSQRRPSRASARTIQPTASAAVSLRPCGGAGAVPEAVLRPRAGGARSLAPRAVSGRSMRPTPKDAEEG